MRCNMVSHKREKRVTLILKAVGIEADQITALHDLISRSKVPYEFEDTSCEEKVNHETFPCAELVSSKLDHEFNTYTVVIRIFVKRTVFFTPRVGYPEKMEITAPVHILNNIIEQMNIFQ